MKNIVILGAGFGGLKAAKTIAKKIKNKSLDKKYEVILVDRNNHQTYTPILYEIATTSKETATYCDLKNLATFPIKTVIGKDKINFIQAGVSSIDLINGDIHLDHESDESKTKLKFDYLFWRQFIFNRNSSLFQFSIKKHNSFSYFIHILT